MGGGLIEDEHFVAPAGPAQRLLRSHQAGESYNIYSVCPTRYVSNRDYLRHGFSAVGFTAVRCRLLPPHRYCFI